VTAIQQPAEITEVGAVTLSSGTGADIGIADTLRIFMGRFSLVSRSYLDLADLDLDCVRGQSQKPTLPRHFVMASSRSDRR
jgi:hypothetical protein